MASMQSIGLKTPRSPSSVYDDTEHRSPFSKWRKYTILFIVSWMTLAATYSITSLLSATNEIASGFSTTTEVINITNAGVLVAMGLSSFIWGPVSEIVGRRNAYNAAIGVLLLSSIGAALARNMTTFTAMRVLGGSVGTFFMVAGQTIIADVFEPTIRGTAVGFFMVGSVIGPALGPCIGGIIVTFTSWRVIYWTQVGIVVPGLLLSLVFLPQIQQADRDKQVIHGEKKQPCTSKLVVKFKMFNPMRILRPMRFPNVLLAHIICGFLAIYQYGLLTSIRSTANPRFDLTTPLISGLFYISPGTGFVVGSIVGGRLSDRTVKLYIKKRNGLRLPQDRLHSGLLPLCLVLPVATLVYGWSLQEEVGGMALPIIAAFFGGAGLMGSYNGFNTYAAEVLPDQKAEVISSKYIVQYLFAAGANASVLPVINAIGVGWAFTVCTCFVLVGGVFVLAIAKRGTDMQKWAEGCAMTAGPIRDDEDSV